MEVEECLGRSRLYRRLRRGPHGQFVERYAARLVEERLVRHGTWRCLNVVGGLLSWIAGRRYVVNFPFCSICKPEDFDIHARRINEKFGFFGGVSNTFLKLLPTIPVGLAAELERTWAQRALRSFVR